MIIERSRFLKSRIILILVGVLVLFTIFFYIYAFRGFLVNPDTIIISKSDVKDGKLVLSGWTTSSAAAYSGYTYRVKERVVWTRTN